MVAAIAATPQAPKSATEHHPTELAYLDCDDTTGIVHFTADSKSAPGTVNTVGLDIITGATFCDCQSARCGRVCWHIAHVAAAWLAAPALAEVRYLTEAQLLRYGTKHALCVETYRARTGRVRPADMLALVAARSEYRRRAALALAATRIQDEIGSGLAAPVQHDAGEDRVIAHYAVARLAPVAPLSHIGTALGDTPQGSLLAA